MVPQTLPTLLWILEMASWNKHYPHFIDEVMDAYLLVQDDTAGTILSPDLSKPWTHSSSCLCGVSTWISHRDLHLSMAKMHLSILPTPHLLLLHQRKWRHHPVHPVVRPISCSHPWLLSWLSHSVPCQLNLYSILKIEPLLTLFAPVQACYFSPERPSLLLQWSPCTSTSTPA